MARVRVSDRVMEEFLIITQLCKIVANLNCN